MLIEVRGQQHYIYITKNVVLWRKIHSVHLQQHKVNSLRPSDAYMRRWTDNGPSPVRRQAITWTNARILLIGPSETNFSDILIGIQMFSFKKMHLKMSSAKWRPFCLGLNELRYIPCVHCGPRSFCNIRYRSIYAVAILMTNHQKSLFVSSAIIIEVWNID